MTRFNNSQRLGLDIDKHIALDAGAGTGKTTVMAQRYIQHLLSPIQRATIATLPGPREDLRAADSLKSSKQSRTHPKDWLGLLPAEVAAITFTRKAASELKGRIRNVLSLLSDTSLSGKNAVFDPRLQKSGDVEMLLSELDNAPISTIDSFLSQLVQPYLDLVAITPPVEQISEEMSQILILETLSSIWRMRHVDDALEAGLLENPVEFLEARDRLTVRLGGQANAEIVIQGLMSKSMFVEEAYRNLMRRAEEKGVEFSSQHSESIQLLFDIMLDTLNEDELDIFTEGLHQSIVDWVDNFRAYSSKCIPSGSTFSQSRMHHLIHLAEHPPHQNPLDKLRWIWRVCLSISSFSSLSKGKPSYFPRGNLPDDEWVAGLLKKGETTFSDKELKNEIFSKGVEFSDAIKEHLNHQEHSIFLLLARCVFTIQPEEGYSFMPSNAKSYLYGLEKGIPTDHEHLNHYVSEQLQMDVMQDLFFIHKGAHQIHSHRKSIDGFNDFDDILRFAADLLLTRCPDMCRQVYPKEAVEALDSMTSEPWKDAHIARALTILHDDDRCRNDLLHRIQILKNLRRQFRAFIIDEYQDTNPSHARLLSRLWGRRLKLSDQSEKDDWYWGPTICIVGDMKQSIYRFRQAEVSVMRDMVEQIRRANRQEYSNPSLQDIRKEDHGRDPRPVGDGASGNAFTNKHNDKEKSAPHTYIHFAAGDDEEGKFITDLDRIQRRREGHIDLTTNYRTNSHLLEFMNDVFDDVFSSRHETIVGNWYAEPQRLRPGRNQSGGHLEWLVPIQTHLEQASVDMNKAFDPFLDSRSSVKQLENELIAQRIEALLSKQQTRVWDTENLEWVDIVDDSVYQPSDIMVLFHARTHVADLIQRLSHRGIPAVSDKQGALLHQPVIQPLISMLELIANPESKRALFGVLRSPLAGLSDDEIHELFHLTLEDDLFSCFHSEIFSGPIRKMFVDLNSLRLKGRIEDAFAYLIDYSDLLVVHSSESERNHVESWCELLKTTLAENGYNILATQKHMNALKNLGKKGPPAESSSSSNAVQIMTLHKSKGLQAKVIVVAGMFDAGQRDASQSVQDNVLVTPQVVAGRIQPWTDHDRPHDGLWEFTKAIDDAQGRAERRRQLYVALTRAEERLIFVGSPSSMGSYHEDSKCFQIKRSQSTRSFGNMLIDALRHVAKRGGDIDSPWLLEGDMDENILPPMDDSPIYFNPKELLNCSTFHSSAIQSLRVYHHPECFQTKQPDSVMQQSIDMFDRIVQTMDKKENGRRPSQFNIEMKGAAYDIDTSYRCPRRYWLGQVLGWHTEPLFLRQNDAHEISSNLPNPREFGLMMHRLLEVGLPNPINIDEHTAKLSIDWHIENENKLLDIATIESVLSEYGITNEHMKFEPTKNRILAISELIEHQKLGLLLKGQEMNGFIAEGVRTELPIRHIHHVENINLELTQTTPFGDEINAIIDEASMIFEGRIDLVIALRDSKNHGYLQVVDLKTKGCLDEFSIDMNSPHPLQVIEGDPSHPLPTTTAEAELLQSYRLQLTLYSMALESIESRKPHQMRRRILPPAILVGASGRMVELTPEQYVQAKNDLSQHLEWRTKVNAAPGVFEAPKRLDSGEECMSCPFFRGHVRRCGPVSEPLGFILPEQ
jgi:ATP-dependent exoDNAse (exonuclease V) beta subunit